MHSKRIIANNQSLKEFIKCLHVPLSLDKGTREEITRIAAELGLTFDEAANLLARKIIAEKGLDLPAEPETAETTVFHMTSDDFKKACLEAAARRKDLPAMDNVPLLDKESGKSKKGEEQKGWQKRAGRSMNIADSYCPRPLFCSIAEPRSYQLPKLPVACFVAADPFYFSGSGKTVQRSLDGTAERTACPFLSARTSIAWAGYSFSSVQIFAATGILASLIGNRDSHSDF